MGVSDEFNAFLEEKINRVELAEFHPDKFKELLEWKRAIIADIILNNQKNGEYYLQFAERVKEEEFFRLHHIDDLNLPYDILIFVSEKNIGKSRQMLTHMNEAYARGKEFVIMRSLQEHLITGLATQLLEIHSNFKLGANGNILHKSDNDSEAEEENTWGYYNKYKKRTKKIAGKAMALTTCTKWKGASFDNTEFLWFDEATDEHENVTINEFKTFFIKVANSIERRKDNFKIIITGNTDFSTSHPLFEYFELDPEQNLIYTTRKAPGANQESRILYINSRGLYKVGAKNSKFIGAGGDPKAALDAFMNNVRSNTDRLVALDLTYLAEPWLCLIFKDHEGKEWQLVIAKHSYTTPMDGWDNIEEKTNTWYYIKIEPFCPAYLCGYKIYTNDLTMHTLYKNYTYYKKDCIKEWITIRRIIKSGKVIFVKKQTKFMLFKLLEKNTAKADYILA